jgi:hypothetical protein
MVAGLEAVVEQDVGGLDVSVQRARLARCRRVQVDKRARSVAQDAQPVPPLQRRWLDRVAEGLWRMHSRCITVHACAGLHSALSAHTQCGTGYLQRICICICGASAVHLRCICGASAVDERLQARPRLGRE